MAEMGDFNTREERDAFEEFLAADVANFDVALDVNSRLALAWGAARGYFTRDADAEQGSAEPAKEIGLSEFGRGHAAGLAEYNDRALRVMALEHAVKFGGAGAVARAKEFLGFLQGN